MKNLYLYVIITLLFTAFHSKAQVDLTSSDLPIVVINTNEAIVDEPKRPGTMGIIYNGAGQRNEITDPFNHYNGHIGIELRGQSSQFFYNKKSYGVETRNADGSNNNVALLGMPEENDWVFYGPFGDKTMARNVLIYQLSNEIGQYASRTRFCEMVLNGEYAGVYIIMEKIKRDKNRVDIAKLTPDMNSGDELTGGYIVRLDKYDPFYDINIWSSDFSEEGVRMEYQVVYPRQQELTNTQFDYIQDFMYDFETALTSDKYKDPDIGYRKYIDVESFVDYLLLNELARNPDAYRLSTYFHKQRDSNGGKLRMGPIWDFNISMGNADFCMKGDYQSWVLNYNTFCENDFWLIGYWWDRLLTDEYFVEKVIERWQELRQTIITTPYIHQIIDSIATEVNEAQARNFQQWDILGEYVWPNPFIGNSYNAEIQYLKTWFTNRVNWIDQNIDQIAGQVGGPYSSTNTLIYPNPVQNQLFIDIQMETQQGDYELEFLNTMGQEVLSVKLFPVFGLKTTIEVPSSVVNKLSQGLYIYNLRLNGTTAASGKILKQ